MMIKVFLFAAAKEIAGREQLELSLETSATIADVRRELIKSYPSMEQIIQRSVFSIDQEYTRDNRRVYHGAEVGLIPPVSGG